MKDCCVCNKDNAGYKCPTCRVCYCSVDCYKTHKKDPCRVPQLELVEEPHEPLKYDFPTEDTVPMEKLDLLKCSNEVKQCLNNSHVRDIVRGILNNRDPTKAIDQAMTEPIFVELADACLKVVEESFMEHNKLSDDLQMLNNALESQ